ncbi:MAG: response regulator transcription factor [Candidatus Acidiferrales bacterium]
MRKTVEHGSRISVLITEHSLMACQLMETALERSRNISVLASVVDASECLDAYKNLRPDVCIISARLKDGLTSGYQLTKELRTLDPDSRAILLLETSERSSIIAAFRVGAQGVFTRNESFDVFCKCIQKVSEGQVCVSDEQMRYLLETLAGSKEPTITDASGASLLTKRDMSVVQLVAEGRTNRDIARELGLSEHTVRNYLFRIFNKLGTSNRLELALYAINQGIPNRGEVSPGDS